MEDGRWDDVVYSSQTAVEQASKAVLLALGVGYPRGHDVSAALRMVPGVKGVPGWFKYMVDGVAGNVSELPS